MTMLIIASLSFVGTHFLMSHPLRAWLTGSIGERAFMTLYSVVSFATLGWMIAAYLTTPVGPPLWSIGNVT
jgi:uncharacterized membrane protein